MLETTLEGFVKKMFGTFTLDYAAMRKKLEEEAEEAERARHAVKEEEEEPSAEAMDQTPDEIAALDWMVDMPDPNASMVIHKGDLVQFNWRCVPKEVPGFIVQAMNIISKDTLIARDHQGMAALHLCIPALFYRSPLVLLFMAHYQLPEDHDPSQSTDQLERPWLWHTEGFVSTMCRLQQFRDVAIKGLSSTMIHKNVNLDALIESRKLTMKTLADELDQKLDAMYASTVPSYDYFVQIGKQYALNILHVEERFLYELLLAPYEGVPPLEMVLTPNAFPIPTIPKEVEKLRKDAYVFFQIKLQMAELNTIRIDLLKNNTIQGDDVDCWLPKDVVKDYYHFSNVD